MPINVGDEPVCQGLESPFLPELRKRSEEQCPLQIRVASASASCELAARRGWQLEVERRRGGISLPNFLARPELPVLDGLGPIGGGMHTRGEYLDLGSLERRIVPLADLLDDLA